MTTTITASELKNNTANILNQIAYGGQEFVIERHGTPIAKITPLTPTKATLLLQAILDKYYGAIPDFPDIENRRRPRQTEPSL